MKAMRIRTRAIARDSIPRFEQFLGGAILLFILLLGIGIYLKGQRYDPHRFALDPAALESTRTEIEGKAATLRASDQRGFELTGSVSNEQASTSRAKVLPSMVDGFSPMGATEHYLPDTLFEKINGRAPAYLEFNFKELTCRSFTMDVAPGQFVDVYIYSMDTPLNAFGIFSLERDGSGDPVDFVMDGYRSEMGYFFRQGLAYVQVLASDSSESVMTAAESFARALAASIPVDNTGLGAISLLPGQNRIDGSLNYIQSDAYGQSRLVDVYEAGYQAGDMVLTFFVMQAGSETEAGQAWEQLKDFNSTYAEIAETGEMANARFLVSDNFGEWNVLFIRDRAIGGVVNAPDKESARTFVEKYLNGEAPGMPANQEAASSVPETDSDYDYEGGGYEE